MHLTDETSHVVPGDQNSAESISKSHLAILVQGQFSITISSTVAIEEESQIDLVEDNMWFTGLVQRETLQDAQVEGMMRLSGSVMSERSPSSSTECTKMESANEVRRVPVFGHHTRYKVNTDTKHS